MSYKVQIREDGRAYPVIVCDHCRKPIVGDGEGNALWLENDRAANKVGAEYDVRHAHKECTAAFERTHPAGPGGHWMFNEIDHHLFMLLRNCRYNAREGERKARILSLLD